MRRDCTNEKKIQWFEFESHYAFHYVNAWEAENDNGDELIFFYGAVMKNLDSTFKSYPFEEHPFLYNTEEGKN